MKKGILKYLLLAIMFCGFADVTVAQKKRSTKKVTTRKSTKRTTKTKTKARIQPTMATSDTMISKCGPGSSVTFTNIKVAGPDGSRVIDERSITLY